MCLRSLAASSRGLFRSMVGILNGILLKISTRQDKCRTRNGMYLASGRLVARLFDDHCSAK